MCAEYLIYHKCKGTLCFIVITNIIFDALGVISIFLMITDVILKICKINNMYCSRINWADVRDLF